MSQAIKTAGVVAFRDDEVLLVRHGEEAQHSVGTYSLPAGHVEAHETALEAAIRELREETGLATTPDHLKPLPTVYTATIARKDGTRNYSMEVFLCDKVEGALKSSAETVPEWIRIKVMGQLTLLPNVETIVQDAMKMTK
jgi:ADP-ribose pyrophosphatase YjhB (NUDIX family)